MQESPLIKGLVQSSTESGLMQFYIKENNAFVQISPAGKMNVYYGRYEDNIKAEKILRDLVVCDNIKLLQDIPRTLDFLAEGLKARLTTNHSKHDECVASGLLALIRGTRYYIEGKLIPRQEYVETALEHLKTGYPKTYALCIRIKSSKKEMEKKVRVLQNLLGNELKQYIMVEKQENLIHVSMFLLSENDIDHLFSSEENPGKVGDEIKFRYYGAGYLLGYMPTKEKAEQTINGMKKVCEKLTNYYKYQKLKADYFKLGKQVAKETNKLEGEINNLAEKLWQSTIKLDGKCEQCDWQPSGKEKKEIMEIRKAIQG